MGRSITRMGLAGGVSLVAAAVLGCGGLLGPSHPVSHTVDGVQLPQVDGAGQVPVRAYLLPDPDADGLHGMSESTAERCMVGEDVVGDIPLVVGIIEAAPGGELRAAGVTVGTVALDGSLPASDLKGQLHVRLYDHLLDLAEGAKELSSGVCAPWAVPGERPRFHGRLLIAADERLPYATVRTLLYTAGQAQFTRLGLVVDDADVRADPGFRADDSAPSGVLQANMPVVSLRADGLSIGAPVGAGHRLSVELPVPCEADPCTELPLDALRERLGEVRPATGETASAIVVPEVDTSWGHVADVLSATARSASGEDVFPHLVLAGTLEDSQPSSHLPDPAPRPAPTLSWTAESQVPVLITTLPMLGGAPPEDSEPLAARLAELAGKELPPAPEPAPPTGGLAASGSSEGLGGLGGAGATSDGGLVIGEPTWTGSIDEGLAAEVVSRHRAQLRYCHQRAAIKDPSLAGEVVVKLVVAKDGTVSSAEVASSTLGSSSVESCLTGRFDRMRFPAPKGGGIAIGSWPLTFGGG